MNTLVLAAKATTLHLILIWRPIEHLSLVNHRMVDLLESEIRPLLGFLTKIKAPRESTLILDRERPFPHLAWEAENTSSIYREPRTLTTIKMNKLTKGVPLKWYLGLQLTNLSWFKKPIQLVYLNLTKT